MIPMPEISTVQIEQNFADINPQMSRADALAEANRCLYCYDAPCMHACPTHIDVPGFIKKIASGNLTGSARVIFDANPIGATCARVCPVEVLCEGACVEKTLMNKPIEIGRLQRYATDHVTGHGKQLFSKGEANGRSIGVVGSGPAGISCATYLARLGYDVTIYDSRALPGGLDTYGMAEYKMSQADSLREIAQLEQLGVKFHLSTTITPAVHLAYSGTSDAELCGTQLTFSELAAQHDAIFVGVGLGKTRQLDIGGEGLRGVYDALRFIELIKSRNWASVPVGKSVAVIGAGNTAIDAVTQAKRLGAEHAILIYRRTELDAPAYDYEIELAKKDGTEFLWNTVPLRVMSNGNGSVSGLVCQRSDGEEFELACDVVIKAIGQNKMRSFFTDVCEIEIDELGRVIVDDLMQTSNPKVFAGGDCVNGGGEAVEAAQMGKLAAQGMHQSLTDEIVQFAGASVPAVQPSGGHPH